MIPQGCQLCGKITRKTEHDPAKLQTLRIRSCARQGLGAGRTVLPIHPALSEDWKMSFRPAEKVTPLRPPKPCPECGKPSSRDSYPFCSARCKAVDLNRWFSGAYV